jgi:hypothetical protein
MGKATTLANSSENMKSLTTYLMGTRAKKISNIRPELIVFAEGNVKLDWIGMVSLASKHSHRVMENVRATLNTLVQPTGAIFVLVDGDTVCLTTTVVYSINERNVEFVGLLGEVVSAAHACYEDASILIPVIPDGHATTHLQLQHPRSTPFFSFVLPFLHLCQIASEKVDFLVSKVCRRLTCEAGRQSNV